MSKDLFGIEEPEDEDLIQPYVIIQLITASGWRVIMADAHEKATIHSLACFALVELKTDTPDGAPARLVRPMIAMPDGQIEDVETFEEFLCLVPPNGADTKLPRELEPLVAAAKKQRENTGH
jgi:hypothetical protein